MRERPTKGKENPPPCPAIDGGDCRAYEPQQLSAGAPVEGGRQRPHNPESCGGSPPRLFVSFRVGGEGGCVAVRGCPLDGGPGVWTIPCWRRVGDGGALNNVAGTVSDSGRSPWEFCWGKVGFPAGIHCGCGRWKSTVHPAEPRPWTRLNFRFKMPSCNKISWTNVPHVITNGYHPMGCMFVTDGSRLLTRSTARPTRLGPVTPSQEGLFAVIWLCAPVKQSEAPTKETRRNVHKKKRSF